MLTDTLASIMSVSVHFIVFDKNIASLLHEIHEIQCHKIIFLKLLVAAPLSPVDPCTPSPCGPYSVCKVIGESPSCICQSNYVGTAPNCRPECVSNSECPSNLACVNQKCKDPCPGSCGYNADCKIISHALVCSCPFGQTGDPLISCNPIKGKLSILIKK